jgi:hypothetical protein
VEGLAATSAMLVTIVRLRLLVSVGASPSRRLTGRRLFDNRRGEVSRVEHSDGAPAPLPADILSSTVQLGARGEIVESLAAPRSLLLASPAAVTKALVWGAVFWVLVAVVASGERRPSHLTSGGVGHECVSV